MNEATKRRTIELQESASYWYREARLYAGAEKSYMSVTVDLSMHIDEMQRFARTFADKARAILCD